MNEYHVEAFQKAIEKLIENCTCLVDDYWKNEFYKIRNELEKDLKNADYVEWERGMGDDL